MAEQASAAGQGVGGHGGGHHGGGHHAGGHGGTPHQSTGHASVGFYWMIGTVLAIITGAEVAVFYIPTLAPVLVPVLLVLSAAKFAIVVMFFMHLKFDSKVFTGVFIAGLILATFMVTALVVLYHMIPDYGV